MLDAELLAKLKKYNRGLKILCVDDEDLLRDFLLTILSSHFEHVDCAANGQEALELYREIRHDLILTDIKMPVMNGLELVREIRKISQEQPILVFSAYQEANELIELINLSINHFLIKPFSIVSLIKKLIDMSESIYLRNELINYQNKLEKLVEDKTLKIRKQKEQIEKKNDFLQEIIDALKLPFLVAEIQNEKIIHANREAQSVIIPPGNSRFHHFFDQALLDELTEYKSALIKEKALETENDGLRLYTAYNFPVLEESGKIKQVIQYLVDITDLTRNLISVQSTEAKLRFELNNERIISDLAKTANQATVLKDALQQILFIISHSFTIDTVAYYQVDKKLECLNLVAESSTDDSPIKLLDKIAFSDISHQTQNEIRQGSKIVHPDLHKLDPADRELFTSMKIKALLLMPVICGSEVCGVTAFLQQDEHFWNYKYYNLFATANGIISSLTARSI